MNCRGTGSRISAYVDGELPEPERQRVRMHLTDCSTCNQKRERLLRLRQKLHAAPMRMPPAGMTANLRVIASVERDRRVRRGRYADRIRLMLDNIMRPLAVPVAGGIFSAVLLFGALVPSFTPHRTPGDVPTGFVTEPTVKSMVPLGLVPADAIVDVNIDEEGHPIDYSIVANPASLKSEALRHDIENNLLFTRFSPATMFGVPTAGTIRLCFRSSRIEVRG